MLQSVLFQTVDMARLFVAKHNSGFKKKLQDRRRRNRSILFATEKEDNENDLDSHSDIDSKGTGTDDSSDGDDSQDVSEYSTKFLTDFCNKNWPTWSRDVNDEIIRTYQSLLQQPSDEQAALLAVLENFSDRMIQVRRFRNGTIFYSLERNKIKVILGNASNHKRIYSNIRRIVRGSTSHRGEPFLIRCLPDIYTDFSS